MARTWSACGDVMLLQLHLGAFISLHRLRIPERACPRLPSLYTRFSAAVDCCTLAHSHTLPTFRVTED